MRTSAPEHAGPQGGFLAKRNLMDDFEVREKSQVYSGRVVGLSVETIILPGGRETTRELVQHPGAAAIVPMLSPREVVLIKQFRYCVKKSLWEIPAGTVEAGETAMACAERELTEETGYRAGRMRHLGSFFTTPGFCNEIVHLFYATDLKPSRANLDKDEQLEVHTVALEDALHMIESGEIADAKTIVGLMRVGGMRRETPEHST